MKTAYVVKAHVDRDGRVVSDEAVPLPPGPVEVTVTKFSEERTTGRRFAGRKRVLKAVLKQIDAIKAPAVPRDGKTIDELLYG